MGAYSTSRHSRTARRQGGRAASDCKCGPHPGACHSGLYRSVSAQRVVQRRHHKAEGAAGTPPRGATAAFRGLRLPLRPLGGLQMGDTWGSGGRGLRNNSKTALEGESALPVTG